MTRLLLVPGSLRAGSFNLRLLRDIAQRLHGRCEVDMLLPRQVGLPLFDQDLEAEPGVMAQVRALHRRFAAAHGLVVASPAYNGQLTPYLKNLVDWVARLPEVDRHATNAFLDRPVLLCSATRERWDGEPAVIPNARALFGHVGALVLGATVSLPRAAETWSADGFGFSPRMEAEIEGAVAHLVRQAEAFDQRHPAALPSGLPGRPGQAAWPLPQREAAGGIVRPS
ncbi:NAD(P)H-dependent oxidoreductase [Ideonella sp. DXS22W]|uniref:NAD(P)H-dependent oxidoreductase n=1 Tax=Pseudaquabacterium inlustre TaxID=2984192 RepID=A0ABU9CI88_9BURK